MPQNSRRWISNINHQRIENRKLSDERTVGDVLGLSVITNNESRLIIIPHHNESLDGLKAKLDDAWQGGAGTVLILANRQQIGSSYWMTKDTEKYKDLLVNILMVIRTRNKLS